MTQLALSFDAPDDKFAKLNEALKQNVPLLIAAFRARYAPAEILNSARLQELAEDIGTYGDVLMFGSKKRPEAQAEHFGRLCETIARLAFLRGGVTFYGVHYEAVAVAP
jgi:hypothetical protein